ASPPAPNRLVIEDPTGRQILSTSVEVTESGSFDHSFQLPEGKTGHHSIRFEYPEELEAMDATENWYEREAISMNARFHLPLRVEEFRRNAFEISHEVEAHSPGAEEVALLLKAA